MRVIAILAALIGAACFTTAHAADDPFAMLRAAYAARDADAAAAAYAADGVVTYRYDGAPEEVHRGRAAIEASFRAFFAGLPQDAALDLNFRVARREGAAVSGVYRLKLGREASYGTFAVTLNAEGLFQTDESGSATRDDFEALAGPVMLDADNDDLDAVHYGQFTGRYVLPDGCFLVVTRSVTRLFYRNTCTQAWRGMVRVDGLRWTAGDRVRSDAVVTEVAFDAPKDGASLKVTLTESGEALTAVRANAYRPERVSFAAADGTRLEGTLYLPVVAARPAAATVMLHGSGPQDRDGYASIIAVMADAFAASGRVVLAFDKRGVGGSDGDWSRAGFDVMGSDARAAMTYLATRAEVDPARVGLAGSSQAGWVAAAAIAGGAKPADVFLLGAAGTALTVEGQNLYNTEVRMRCAGYAEEDIILALDQQMAFFAFLRDPSKADELDALTRAAEARPGLLEWLFPNSKNADRSGSAWYVVLDPDFDPIPVWRAYQGRKLFVFSELDDATPTHFAVRHLKGSGAITPVLKGAQHLGLMATDICKAELADLKAFSPALFDALEAFAR